MASGKIGRDVLQAGTYELEMPAFGFVTTGATTVSLQYLLPFPLAYGRSIGNLEVISSSQIRIAGGGYLSGIETNKISSNWLFGRTALHIDFYNQNGWGIPNNSTFNGLLTLRFTVS
jgi:hypothetical protein